MAEPEMITILLWLAGVGFVGIVGYFIYVMATATQEPPQVPSPYGMLRAPTDSDLLTTRAAHPDIETQEGNDANASETGDNAE